jgi:2-succinyl-6-hydroxy-2,4-cyclohexadiene-1-carboxylate synthase
VRYLLLHGFTGTSESFAGLGVPPGSVAPTLGGHLSCPVRGNFNDEVERLAELGAGCDGLFGYSLGGRLALGILARYPERFRHAVIVSAHPGLRTDEERSARRKADARYVGVLREQGLVSFVDKWQALPLWASQGDLPESTRLAQRQQRLRHDPLGLAQSLIHHGLGEMPDLRAALARVTCSVDVVAGERDQKFAELARELAELIPSSRLHIVPGAGHNLLLERAALCSALLRFGAAA